MGKHQDRRGLVALAEAPNMNGGEKNALPVTVIHDESTAVKHCINELKRLSRVEPPVIFDYCPLSEFKDIILQRHQLVLVILSKESEAFRRKVYNSLLKQKRSFLAKPIRVCVITETDSQSIDERFESMLGDDNVAIVKDLLNSFSWLPKVCTFIYKPSKQRKYLQKCVIPKLVEDVNLALLRKSLISSLRELKISVSEELHQISSYHCGFILRTIEEETVARYIRRNMNAGEKGGAIILDYVLHYDDRELHDSMKKRVTFAKESRVLFILHVLFIVGLIDIHTINGEKAKRRISRPTAVWENLPWFDIILCLLMSFLNPGLLIYLLTPFPYIALLVFKLTRKKFIWTLALTTWMILFLVSGYGVGFYFLARESYFLYALAGLAVLFIFSSLCTFMIIIRVMYMFEKFRDLSLL